MLPIRAAGFNVDPLRIIIEPTSGLAVAMQRTDLKRLLHCLERDNMLILVKLDGLRRNAIDIRASVEQLAEI
jgi:putative DNA-invertase from lambdoid prophage Rac